MVNGCVLIVDSDRTTVRQLVTMLTPLPLQLTLAFSKCDALEACLRQTFDLCVVAHGLADGNGLELFRDSLRKRSDTVAVLLSRYADLGVVMSAVDAGFSHVINTPVDFAQLRPILGRVFPVLGQATQVREVPKNAREMSIGMPDLEAISNLSLAQIRNTLSNEELISIIRAVDYPFAGKERLEYFDRDTIERVVCLIRRWSQQRIAARNEPTHSALDDCPMIPDSTKLDRKHSIRVSA